MELEVCTQPTELHIAELWKLTREFEASKCPYRSKGNMRSRQAKRKHIVCGFNFQNVIAKRMSNDRHKIVSKCYQEDRIIQLTKTPIHIWQLNITLNQHILMVSPHLTFNNLNHCPSKCKFRNKVISNYRTQGMVRIFS